MQTLEALGKYTFQHLLENSVKLFKERPAVSFADKTPITYGEFYKKVKQTQKLLTNLGLQSGDHIAIFSPSSPFWGITYFAIVLMGCVAVPLLHDFSENEVVSCLKHSNSKALFVSKKMLAKLQNLEDINIIVDIEDSSVIKGATLNNNETPAYLCNE